MRDRKDGERRRWVDGFILLRGMRGGFGLVLRWICSLAAVLALWPARAGGPVCAAPVPTEICRKPCCKPKVEATNCCKSNATITSAEDSCKCEFRPAPSSGPGKAEAKAVVPVADVEVLFSSPLPVVQLVLVWPTSEPGIVGGDSGPPVAAPSEAHSGRAPPAR